MVTWYVCPGRMYPFARGMGTSLAELTVLLNRETPPKNEFQRPSQASEFLQAVGAGRLMRELAEGGNLIPGR